MRYIYIYAVFLTILLTACNGNQVKSLNEKIDSLSKENFILKQELERYKHSPKKLLAEIKQSYTEKQYSKIKAKLDLFKKYHPEAIEYKNAKEIYNHSIKEQELAKKKAEAAKAAAEAKRKAKMAPIEKIMEKYSCSEEIANLILRKKVRIGMTSKQCIAAWGRPDDINRTVGSFGVHEQWVYGEFDCSYLYFEDDILTSFQN